MIEYKLIKKNKGMIGLMVRGHAFYAPMDKDIVCAAVSSTCYTAVNGCIKQVKSDKDINIQVCKPGHFVFTVVDTPETRALVEATHLQLENIAKQYPQCFKH